MYRIYSSFNIETRYRLDGSGFETRWERVFPHPSRPAPMPIRLPVQWVPGLFVAGKIAGMCLLPPTRI